jgi:hypothetical protein
VTIVTDYATAGILVSLGARDGAVPEPVPETEAEAEAELEPALAQPSPSDSPESRLS